jgi:hypothetical protein
MIDIYNNATVTISADAAMNSSEGLFPNPQERQSLNGAREINCKGRDGQPSQIYVRHRHEDPFNIENPIHSSIATKKSKLITRGWVLQEELLSPRMLHFNKEEMSWICSTYSRCECRIRPAQPLPHLFRASPGMLPPSPEVTHRLHLEWPIIVMEFTRRCLTKPSDRITALSGLAAWVDKRTSNTSNMTSYVSGLWVRDLGFQLLWYSGRQEHDSNLATRYKDPYAPSWSWASISGPISYYGRIRRVSPPQHPAYLGATVEPLFERLEVGCLFQGPNKYGPVTQALMIMSARVLPVTFDRVQKLWIPDVTIYDFDPNSLKINIDVPSELPSTWDEDSAKSYCFILAGRWTSVEDFMTVSSQAVCLLVRRMVMPRVYSEDGVLLYRASFIFKERTLGRDKYRRVGLVRGAGSIQA